MACVSGWPSPWPCRCDPELLIADEPTTALDVTVQAQILEEFEKLQERMGMAVLLGHPRRRAWPTQMADRVAVMYAGRIVEIGPAAAVLDHPAHPYTEGLLSCLPAPGTSRGDLHPLPGYSAHGGGATGRLPVRAPLPAAHDACAGHRARSAIA